MSRNESKTSLLKECVLLFADFFHKIIKAKTVSMNHFIVIFIILSGVILTIGDLIMKKWANGNKILFFVLGMLVYVVGMTFCAVSYKYKNIVESSMMIVLVNVSTLALVTTIYLRETLSIYQIIGVLVGIAVVIFLELTP